MGLFSSTPKPPKPQKPPRRLDITIAFSPEAMALGHKLIDAVEALNHTVQTKGDAIMAAIDDVEARVTELETGITDIGALITKEHQELLDAIAAGADPTRLNAVAARIGAAAQSLKDIAAANPDPQP